MSRLPITSKMGRCGVAAGLSTATIVIWLVLTAQPLFPSKKVPPSTRAEVAQTWIGITEDELYLFRLELHLDGTGLGAYVYVDEEPHVFRVASWTIDQYEVAIKVSDMGWSRNHVGELKGKVVGYQMNLLIGGHDWHRRLWLRPERPLQLKLDQLKTATAGVDLR
jgi:hypothetical protein